MSIAYGIILTVSIVFLILYCTLVKTKEKLVIVLFSCISIVNLGYFLLSLSKSLEFALIANKIAYLGQIFLLISMYLIIVKLCGFKVKAILQIVLVLIGAIIFGLVCTTGYLPWYYESVSIDFANGATELVKEYGPLHVIYLVYVLTLFSFMIITIIVSIIKKKIVSNKQSGMLTAIVLCNIAMWIIEKNVDLNFEFLSVSYILSEGILFFFYWLMQDYVHKDDVKTVDTKEKTRVVVLDSMERAEKIERVLQTLPEGKKLTQRQMDVLEGIIDGKSRKEIAVDLNISENTVKMHTALLYENLGVSNKEQIIAIIYKN